MNARPPEIPPHKLISALRGFNLLPAIVFLPTRRKCDEAATEVAGDKSQKIDQGKLEKRREIFNEFAAANPEIKAHKHSKLLVNFGVASHHAGHIPPWKLLIEKMMSGGLLNAIFATSTVAAGVDFPARTVVISNADTRGNDGWRPLRASELQQMTGRAGRRGKDNVGFVVLAPGQFQNPKKIAELLKASPDPLDSQFRATYTSLLNLLDAFKNFEQVREIAEKSYAFQDTSRRVAKLKSEIERRQLSVTEKLGGSGLSVAEARGFERLVSARNRLNEKIPATRADLRQGWLRENVIAGRIVTQGRSGKRLFLVLNVHGEKVSAMRDDGEGTSFALARVNRVYQNAYKIKERIIEQAFFDTLEGKNKPLDEPKVAFKNRESDEAVKIIDVLIEQLVSLPPAEAGGDLMQKPERKRGRNTQRDDYAGTSVRASASPRTASTSATDHPAAQSSGTPPNSGGEFSQLLWETYQDADALNKFERDIEFLYAEIWQPFENRAKVLDHFGYLDFREEQVTASGKWLADVRVDRPLLVGEALRRGIFDKANHKIAAGLMASLAADSDRNYGDLYLSNELIDLIGDFEDVIYNVSNIEWKFGVEPSEEINLSAAAAAERWADGWAWDDLVRRTQAEEGDLFRLLARTGEALLQVAQLRDSNPAAAKVAHETAEIILREPIR